MRVTFARRSGKGMEWKCCFNSMSLTQHTFRRVTFNTQVSNKKLNSFSLSGDLFAVAGNERVVRVFDIRKFSKKAWNGKRPSNVQQAVASREYGGSINSAFFSPSGDHLLTTCQNDTLTLTPRSALSSPHSKEEFAVGQTIKHDNHTGR